jgi:hypothetical protein
MYPEANDMPGYDRYNADTPSGVVLAGHKALEGVKLAFGPQLYWGANPSLLVKYDRVVGAFEFAVMHQHEIAAVTGAITSSAVPTPLSDKTSVYAAWKHGDLKLEVGGLAAGYQKVGQAYVNAVPSTNPSGTYLNSGYLVLDDTIRWYDTLGAKAKVTWTGGRANAYAQAGYRGLVADSNTDQTITLAGFRLKESGQGNHWHAIAGAAFNLSSSFQIAPNVIYQKPLVGPLPALGDRTTPSGTLYLGTGPRNQLQDPFWVRSNREMLGAELLLVFDPTPATWFWAWDNAAKENAPFAASLDFIYKRLPTAQDSGVGVLASGAPYAFGGSAPAHDLWEVWGRFVANAGALHLAGALWAGTGQPNGADPRLVTRGGIEARLDYGRLVFMGSLKLYDWGPYDYMRDGNLTYRIQANADLAYTADTPRWFFPLQTKFGVAGKYRTLDIYSARYDVTQTVVGQEWEVKTYVRFSL